MTTTTAVRIWCPDWCVTDPQTHLDDLESWEGRVIHSSADFGRLRGEDYALTMIALPDGTPDPEEPHHTPVMCVASDGTLVHPNDMERLSCSRAPLAGSGGGGVPGWWRAGVVGAV